jgi:adenine-specific DNA-methyltransferase
VAKKKTSKKVEVDNYEHTGEERKNNPQVGLVNKDREPVSKVKKNYQYDPHFDPSLNWSGKSERLSFNVPTVSLHVHERIDSKKIISRLSTDFEGNQLSLFERPSSKRPIREAIEFYKHQKDWSNRLISGDSLLVMNSLIEKEALGGKVQVIYMDPPYGIKYGSNFQPFVNKRDVKDGSDKDLIQEPESIKAYRDTWELGIHSYLSYMRDRLLLSKVLLKESGSIFVQISEDNIHHVREIMDEIFGRDNFLSQIAYSTTGGFPSATLSRAGDYLLWYCKNKKDVKYRKLFMPKPSPISNPKSKYDQIELNDGSRRALSLEEKRGKESIPDGGRIYTLGDLTSQGAPKEDTPYKFSGGTYRPKKGNHWKPQFPVGLDRLAEAKRIQVSGNSIRYVRFFDDFEYVPLTNIWTDIGGAVQSRKDPKVYAVQTGTSLIKRCIQMSSDPGDIVFDPTCGSGTSAVAAEDLGRRWITCDSSRVAITITRQRLLTMDYDYYKLQNEQEGISSGIQYETAERITLESISKNEQAEFNYLYDKPKLDNSKARVTGPFTVEAVPSLVVSELGSNIENKVEGDENTSYFEDIIDELMNTGVRGKKGLADSINFTRLQPLPSMKYLNAEGETKVGNKRVVLSIGPKHAPLEQRHVELALNEAQTLVPKPEIILFSSFHFDPEASKDIDEYRASDFILLKAQINTDLLTDDLKRKRSSNESFFLIGQPDISVKKNKDKTYSVQVNGWDYYDPKNGDVISGGENKISMWMLDTDYDGRSMFPDHVFFPMANKKEGWNKLVKFLDLDLEDEIEDSFTGTKSPPFKIGDYNQIAVKIIDDRGIESLKVMQI